MPAKSKLVVWTAGCTKDSPRKASHCMWYTQGGMCRNTTERHVTRAVAKRSHHLHAHAVQVLVPDYARRIAVVDQPIKCSKCGAASRRNPASRRVPYLSAPATLQKDAEETF